MSIYEIDGYWKDDKSEFYGYLVTELDCTPEGYDDDDIFFYGLSENQIKEAIELKENICNDFVITDYRKAAKAEGRE